LVEIIHNAAADPNITALYADFGEGMRYVSLNVSYTVIVK
jgi:hypothetical protein